MKALQGALLTIAMPLVAVAQARESNPVDVMAADFAVNVCGALVGGEPGKFAERVSSFPTANLEKPALLPNGLPGGREALANLLHVDPATPVYRVVFKPQTGDPVVVAFVRTDLKACETLLIGKSNAADGVAEKFDEPGSGWNEINGPMAGQRAWQRKTDAGAVVTFTTSISHGLTILDVNGLLDTLLPTLAEFDAFADVVVGNCVKDVLTSKKPAPDAFLSLFDVAKKEDDGSYFLVSKEAVPGGRLVLMTTPYGTGCVLAIDKTVYSFDFYRRALNQAFLKFPDSKREGPPSLFWVYKDPASHNTALMSEQLEDKQGMLLFAIEREE